MTKREAYLYARHNGLTDAEAAEFADWWWDQEDTNGMNIASLLAEWRQIVSEAGSVLDSYLVSVTIFLFLVASVAYLAGHVLVAVSGGGMP